VVDVVWVVVVEVVVVNVVDEVVAVVVGSVVEVVSGEVVVVVGAANVGVGEDNARYPIPNTAATMTTATTKVLASITAYHIARTP